ncbi:MAG: hypothetical protein ACFCD0_06435 [Gemmataceae bacterium]
MRVMLLLAKMIKHFSDNAFGIFLSTFFVGASRDSNWVIGLQHDVLQIGELRLALS